MLGVLSCQEGEFPLDFDCQLSYHHVPLHGKIIAYALPFIGQMLYKNKSMSIWPRWANEMVMVN